MRYIGGDTQEEGCIFCNRLRGDNDVDSLILLRSRHAFLIMNLYPYNTGHIMVVPNAHVADLDQLDEATLTDMATLLPRSVTALRAAFGCDGFNIGLNIGSVAGAGVAEHLHQHVVPRWEGDANFMPILAGTMAIPEMIPASYAKIRAELSRVMHGAHRFDTVVISDLDQPRAWLRHGQIGSIEPGSRTPVYRAALESIEIDGAELVGWSGATGASDTETRPGVVLRVDREPSGPGWTPISLEHPDDAPGVSSTDRATLRRVRQHLAPWIARPND